MARGMWRLWIIDDESLSTEGRLRWETMSKKRKVIIWTFSILIFLLMVGPLTLIEFAYEKGLSWVRRPLPSPCEVRYSPRIREDIWYVHEKSGKVHVVPEWPWTILWSVSESLLKQNPGSMWSSGTVVASQVGRQYLISKDYHLNMGEWHLKSAAMAIWLTRHWTTEDILDELAEKSYYGHGVYGFNNAAKKYFNKPPDVLTDYQIAKLLALAQSPNLEKRPKDFKRIIERNLSLIEGHGEMLNEK